MEQDYINVGDRAINGHHIIFAYDPTLLEIIRHQQDQIESLLHQVAWLQKRLVEVCMSKK